MESERERARREHEETLERIEQIRRRNREIIAEVKAGLAESRRLSEESRRRQFEQQRRAAAARR